MKLWLCDRLQPAVKLTFAACQATKRAGKDEECNHCAGVVRLNGRLGRAPVFPDLSRCLPPRTIPVSHDPEKGIHRRAKRIGISVFLTVAKRRAVEDGATERYSANAIELTDEDSQCL